MSIISDETPKLQGATDDTLIGNVSDALKTAVTQSALPTGAATSANQTTIAASLSSIDAGIPVALGQTTMSASMSIAIASDQSTLPISAATLPLPAGAATSANQTTEITSLQLLDDVPHAQNTALSKGVPLMGQLDDSSTTVATEDNVAVGRITAQRGLHVNVRNNAGTEIFTSAAPGTVISVPSDGTKITYSAAVVNLTTANLATDVFTISGSATKTVRVTGISLSGLATTGGNVTVNLIKRSTANTAGTSTISTIVPHDSTNTAGTAVVRSYTANPTLGTAVGVLHSNRVFISGGATTGSIAMYERFGALGQAILLRGAAESLCLNLNGVSINGASLNLWVEWTEE